MTIFRGPGGTGSATSDSDTTEFQEFLVQSQAARDAAIVAQAAAQAAAGDVNTGVDAAAASATEAAASASAASTSETNAATSATNAASSASEASTSASNASSSASAAATSATNAGNSATAAATSATAAASSASAASTSEANSLISVTYFGTTPPSSPVAGKRWFNTSDGREYIYLNDGDSSQWIELSGPTSTFADSANVRFQQAGTGAVLRTVQDKSREIVSVKDFGAAGDSTTDDTLAIIAADAAAAASGCVLWFPRGVYRCTDGIIKTAEWCGEGAPLVGSFPLFDDKQYLVPGQKNKLPGSVLLFTGVGTAAKTTLRADQFANMRYCVMQEGRILGRTTKFGQGFAIVCDFNFRNTVGGSLTLPNGDASADYDVGLLLNNCDVQVINDVTVGGYFKKAGTVHTGIDPDGMSVTNLRTMGDIGLAIIGDTSGTNTGFNMHGGALYSNDHHSRSIDPLNERWGTHALFIDIPSPSGTGSRNGISFYGTWLATKTNIPVRLDRCGAIQFFGTIFENADQVGSVLAGGPKKIIGSVNTGDVGFFGCRLNAEQIRGTDQLLGTAPNSTVIIAGSTSGSGIEFWKGLTGGRFVGSATQTNIQLTSDPSTTTSGIVLRRASDNVFRLLVDNVERFQVAASGTTAPAVTSSNIAVSGGAITVSRNFHRLSGGAQSLSTINGGVDGMRLVLVRNTSTDIPTLVDGTGNLRIVGNFTLGSFDTIELMFYGGFWFELSRTDRA